MGQALAFYTLAAFILGFGVLVVTARNTVHSIMFLVVDFLFIAGAVRAAGRAVPRGHPGGGVRRGHRRPLPVRRDAGEPEAPARGAQGPSPAGAPGAGRRAGGAGRAGGDRRLQVTSRRPPRCRPSRRWGPNNVAMVGTMLYTDYLVPFELASILLLVAMVGAIVLARREL